MRLAALTDRIVSASATIIAVVALATGIYQAKLSREQAKAAVWPYLISGNSGNNGYARILQNVGLGPAVIGSFEVRVDGTPYHTWPDVAKALGVSLSFAGSRSTSVGRGIVIPVNATVEIIDLPDSSDVRLIRSKLDHLSTYICYCSFYHDCWTLQDGSYEPQPIKACTDDPARGFAR